MIKSIKKFDRESPPEVRKMLGCLINTPIAFLITDALLLFMRGEIGSR